MYPRIKHTTVEIKKEHCSRCGQELNDVVNIHKPTVCYCGEWKWCNLLKRYTVLTKSYDKRRSLE